MAFACFPIGFNMAKKASSQNLLTYKNLPPGLFVATIHSEKPGTDANIISALRSSSGLPPFPPFTLIRMQQKHTHHCIHLTRLDQPIPICDAIVTSVPTAALCICHADCQATCIYDRQTSTLAVVHAGWRGQVAGIYSHTIQKMLDLGCQAQSMHIIMAPSLGPCCAQIERPPSTFTKQHLQFSNKDNFFDLWQMALSEFHSMGIPKNQVQLPTICSRCDPNFHSYRRNQTDKRNYTIALVQLRT